VPSVDDPPVVRVVLDATHTVEGTVENAGGVPVAVSARRGKEVLGHTGVGESGRFRLDRLPPGIVDLVAVASPGREGRTTGIAVDTSTAVIVLPRAPVRRTVVLEGTVRNAATGENVPGFKATLMGPSERLSAERTAPGRFRFDAAPEGSWTLVVTAGGYASHSRQVEVSAGRPPDPLDIELRSGTTVTGKIENRAGVQLQGARLMLHDDRGHGLQPVYLSGMGQYRVEDAAPGRYWPAIHGAGAVAPVGPFEVVVPEGVAEVRFDFAIAAAGTLKVLNAAERIEVADAAGRTVWLRLEPSGNVHVFLPPGEYTVNGRRAEVTAGSETKLDLGR
jgi:hypothetical protein